MLTILVSPLIDEFIRRNVEGRPPLVVFPLEGFLVVAFVAGIVTSGPSLIGGAALGLVLYYYSARPSRSKRHGWLIGSTIGVLVAITAWVLLTHLPTNWVTASITWEALLFGWIGNHLEQAFMQ
jgi:hypothetical protein